MRRIIISLAVLVIATATVYAQNPQAERPAGMREFRMPEKPSDPAFETKEITIDSRGMKLYGVAVIPNSGPSRKPAVIMSHGYGGNHIGFYSQMAELAKSGYVCYAIDFQGGGRGSKSDGSTREMSIFTEKQNLIDVIDAVREWDCVDPDNLFLLGESQGGCVSAITAPEVKEKIKAIALIYPALCIPDDARALYKTKDDIPAEITVMGIEIGKAYYENLLDYDIYNVIKDFDKDVLIVHGSDDELVKQRYSDKAAEIYTHCEHHIIEGAGHGFYGEQKERSNKYVFDFFQKEIKK